MYKTLIFLVLMSVQTVLYADDNYCYQKPDKCAAGDILILALSEEVAKYCDFDKQIAPLRRHTTSSSFNNQEVVCVKRVSPRKKLK
jgi:hypothetical protein